MKPSQHAGRLLQRGRFRILAAILAMAFMASMGSACSPPPPQTSAPAVALSDIQGIDDLRTRFNQDQGVTRLILLLSPT